MPGVEQMELESSVKAILLAILPTALLGACAFSPNYRGSGPCEGFNSDQHACERAHENSLVVGRARMGDSLEGARAAIGRDPDWREATSDSETWGYLTDYEDERFTVFIFRLGVVVEIKQSRAPNNGTPSAAKGDDVSFPLFHGHAE